MSLTNFSLLTSEQLTMWRRGVWKTARNQAFIGRFLGKDNNSMIQWVTELTKSEKGARAVITLVADLEGDGIAGDRTLEGNEEAMKSYDQVIRIDQLRHANRHEGRMADQKSVVNFRENSKDVLGYWLADRWDQMAFLTLSGVSYAYKTNGPARVGSDLPNLEFAADVTAPTSGRVRNWDGTAKALITANTATIAATDTPSWSLMVQVKAYMKDNFVRPIRGDWGQELYNVFMTPQGLAKLKLDSDFMLNWRHSQERSKDNPLFKGVENGGIYVDGLAIYEYRHVFNTKGLSSGSKWGSGGTIDGQAMLVCGAQALGMADIGMPEWVEKGFDYDNQQGISLGKIAGFKKPVFRSQITSQNEDFGVLRVNTAI